LCLASCPHCGTVSWLHRIALSNPIASRTVTNRMKSFSE